VIALLTQLAIAAAVFLFVASLGFWNDTGRSLRHAALALFFGAFAFSLVLCLLRAALHDWRTYVVWLVLSPVAYLILRAHRGSSPTRLGGQAKRRASDHEQPSQPPPWEMPPW
jgi:hypothetical protein